MPLRRLAAAHRLIDSFKAASSADRVAFAQAVGVGVIFDTAVSPAL